MDYKITKYDASYLVEQYFIGANAVAELEREARKYKKRYDGLNYHLDIITGKHEKDKNLNTIHVYGPIK